MGSFAPVPDAGDDVLGWAVETCIRPVLRELARRGTPFVGTLFAGLMLTPDGPGSSSTTAASVTPETQSVLPLVDGDLLTALVAAATGSLAGVALGRLDAVRGDEVAVRRRLLPRRR